MAVRLAYPSPHVAQLTLDRPNKASEDLREGQRAFVDKRKPRFQGR